jgi:hypothetical protein
MKFILSLLSLCIIFGFVSCSVPQRLRQLERYNEVFIFTDQFLLNQSYCVGAEDQSECIKDLVDYYMCEDKPILDFDGIISIGKDNIITFVERLFSQGIANRKQHVVSLCERQDGTYLAHANINGVITWTNGDISTVAGVDVAYIKYPQGATAPCVSIYWEGNNLRNYIHPTPHVHNPDAIYPQPTQLVNLITCDWVGLQPNSPYDK